MSRSNRKLFQQIDKKLTGSTAIIGDSICAQFIASFPKESSAADYVIKEEIPAPVSGARSPARFKADFLRVGARILSVRLSLRLLSPRFNPITVASRESGSVSERKSNFQL
jgi:hypothetical protein